MGQPITILLTEQEYAELQRRAEAEQRALDDVAHAMLAEQLTQLPEPLSEPFVPYEEWKRVDQEKWDRIMALPIEERRVLALKAAGNLKLPEGVNAAESVRELRAEWEHRLPKHPLREELDEPHDS